MRRHFKYLLYVLRHKWFVFLAGIDYGVPIWQLIVHDWHKFTIGEWFPYAKTFYAADGTKQYHENDAFNYAWNAHQKRGKHHWQYWLITWDRGNTEALAMPERYWREMLSDWQGAGRANGKTDTSLWYAQNYENIILHPDTRQCVDSQLGIDFPKQELDHAEIVSSSENWPIKTLQEAALQIRRSNLSRTGDSV